MIGSKFNTFPSAWANLREGSEVGVIIDIGTLRTSTLFSTDNIDIEEIAINKLKAKIHAVMTSMPNKYFKGKYIICLDSKESSRKKKHTDYKKNRTHVSHKWTKEFDAILEKMGVEAIGFEADDVAVTFHKAALLDYVTGKSNVYPILVSGDKDLKQTQGVHFIPSNINQGNENGGFFFTVSGREAIVNKYSQVISGDSTDSIDGIPGAGEVTGTKTAKIIITLVEKLNSFFKRAKIKLSFEDMVDTVVRQIYIEAFEEQGVARFNKVKDLIIMQDVELAYKWRVAKRYVDKR